MTDKEMRVLQGLELHCNESLAYRCDECPYREHIYVMPGEEIACRDRLILEIQELLEEQKIKLTSGSKKKPALLESPHKPYGNFLNANAPWISRCPNCGKKVEGKQTRYCKYCGLAVRWE